MKTTTKNHIAILLVAAMSLVFVACQVDSREAAKKRVQNPKDMDTLTFVSGKWNFDEEHKVFYQPDISYAAYPETGDGRMQLYIPGRYCSAKDAGDGKYTITVNKDNYMGVYQADSAPIMIRCEDEREDEEGGQKKTLYSYDHLATFLENGIIVATLPKEAGAAEVKAAIRSLRYNQSSDADSMPGNMDSIFLVGSASAVLAGESANSQDSFDTLTKMGAIMRYEDRNYIPDDVMGVLCTDGISTGSLSQASSAWGFGQFDEAAASDAVKKIAEGYASYINNIALSDESDNDLALEESENGIFASGSYYDLCAIEAESALNAFLSNVSFPYRTDSRNFDSPKAYVDYIRGDSDWVSYDNGSKTARIKDFESFSKDGPHSVNAFTDIKDFDVEKVFSDNTDPLYYLNASYKGHDSSDICKYWQVAMDVNDCDSFLETMNLYLSLKAEDEAVVDLLPFWYDGNVGSQGICDWINTCVSTEAAKE